MDRFDRQLRLWGSFGHELLTSSEVVLIVHRCDDPLFLEVQRHLLLAGISRHLIFHPDKEYASTNGVVTQGFAFVDEDVELQALNPEIIAQRVYLPWSRIQTQSFKDTSVIISINCKDPYPWREVAQRRKRSRAFPPVLVAAVNYPLVYTYLWLKEIHFILTTNPEYTVPDLRIDEPWDGLLEYVDSFNLHELREEELAEIPYPVILCKASVATLQDKRSLYEKLDDYFLKYSPKALNHSNYVQAKRYARKITSDSKLKKERVQELLHRLQIYKQSDWQDSFNGKLMTLCTALGQFLERHHQFPLPSEFPDMEAETHLYNGLKMIYLKKAQEDYRMMVSIVADLGFPDFPKVLIRKFCDNINYWTLLEPTDLKCPVPKVYSNVALMNLMDEHDTIISTREKKLLKSLLYPVEKNWNLSLTFSATAFAGGIVAQEVIKLVTHQYLPIDNMFVYDLIADESLVVRL